MTSISKKQVLSYVFLPQVRPRFKALFASGFQYVPYFIALVYQVVRLLPDNHPYLNPANMGRYGIRHVIAEAANNLTLSRKNIDQILLFFLVLTGFVLIVLQIGLLISAAFVQPVAAATIGTNFLSFFGTANAPPAQDIAMIMMDMVFGVENIFNSCVSTGTDCVDASGATINWFLSGTSWPFPIHHATHKLFAVYSTGLLVVAVFIAFYFMMTVIAETAQTGTPFGKRFNKVWAPIRIVVAIGLLMPLTNGINSSQYIVLYAAKYGSNFATNGWNLFNDELGFNAQAGNTIAGGGSNSKMVAELQTPELAGLLQMIYAAKVCRELELARTFDSGNVVEIEPYLVRDTLSGTNNGALQLEKKYGEDPGGYTSYEDMLDFANGDEYVTIRFGYEDKEKFGKYKGYVGPVCGEIVLPLTDPRPPKPSGGVPVPPGEAEKYADTGASIMQRYYWYIINLSWYWIFEQNAEDPVSYPHVHVACTTSLWGGGGYCVEELLPTVEMAQENIQRLKVLMERVLKGPDSGGGGLAYPLDMWLNGMGDIGEGAVKEQLKSPKWDFSQVLKEKGWAGAGIWYNKVAELNGSLAGAVYNKPLVAKYPQVMEDVLAQRKQKLTFVSGNDRFNPVLPGGEAITFNQPVEKDYANALWEAYKYWQAADYGSSSKTAAQNNPFIDVLNYMFGTEGLFQMRENREVHPLAQLVQIGRSLIEASTRAILVNTAYALFSATDEKSQGLFIGPIMSIVMITITIGFLLFYVIPFLPFIYFFFAIGGWVKGIFEAMVGAPLWALAHIRIDGNGLPGQAAVNGYFLIFEIFLRPILIIFGLLASISTFSALVTVMNDVWDIMTVNVTGASGSGDDNIMEFLRGPVDEFFYTIVYAIIVYMMGMSSFKLIDLIPNNILRWMGQSVSTFNDQNQNAAEGLVGTAGVGGQQAISSIGGGVEGLLKNIGSGGKQGSKEAGG
ncbi:MAG: DotA/TraY family protein [Alphaproteobacteria bacterium]|nr:DotA/TraY family protein [Alphaproteobacteria bacterium]